MCRGTAGALLLRARRVLLSFAAFLTLLLEASGEPVISRQTLEIKFDTQGGVDLVHSLSVAAEEGWAGQVNFTYAFGLEHIFENPQEILDWEKKIQVEAEGCQSTSSFDFGQGGTIVAVELFNASAVVGMVIRMHLMNMVEEVRQYSVPLLTVGRERRRFSMVTPRSNLDIVQTRVGVHLPDGQQVSNYLPTQNVTVLPRGDGRSIFWSFGEASADEARVYVEFGPKGRMGSLMMLILVFAILGVVLAAFKFFLMLYEESFTY